MARRIFLHVATTKTGTTFLQNVMWRHHAELLDQGILLPGESVRDHFRAAMDVRGETHLLRDPEVAAGAWSRLVDDMAAWEGDAVVSHELFAPASAERTAEAVAALGDAEVHVVVTARDLARQIPAEWQEHLKHRSVLTFPEFVHEVRTDPERGPYSPNGYHFWHVQELCDVLDRWRGALPSDRLHVVTVPPAGAAPDELWQRFSGLVGIDGAGFDLSVSRSNSSIRAEQAELLRRLNSTLGTRLPLPGPYPETVKTVLAHKLLAGRPGTKFALVGDDHAYAVERSRALAEGLRAREVDVVGDLADLVPGEEPGSGSGAGTGGTGQVSGDASTSPELVLEEAVEALAEILHRFAGERTRRQRLRAELDEAEARLKELEQRVQADSSPARSQLGRAARALKRRARP